MRKHTVYAYVFGTLKVIGGNSNFLGEIIQEII